MWYGLTLVKLQVTVSSEKTREMKLLDKLFLLQLSVRGKSHIDFRTQSVLMTLGGGGVCVTITNDVLKFRKLSNFKAHELS